MRNLKRFFAALAVGLFFVGVAAADTLELKSGKVVQGKYLGGTQAVLRFEINGEVQTFARRGLCANGGSRTCPGSTACRCSGSGPGACGG